MKTKNYSIIMLSSIEIIRWCILYIFLIFVKSNFNSFTLFNDSSRYFFITTVLVNILFAVSGIIYGLGFENYRPTINLWKFYKVISILILVSMFFNREVSLLSYFTIAPLDIFIVIYLILSPSRESDISKHYPDISG